MLERYNHHLFSIQCVAKYHKVTSEKHTNKLKANEKTVVSSQALNNNSNKIIPTVD